MTTNSPNPVNGDVQALDYFGSLVNQARARAEKAMTKFPQPNYVLNKVAEESGEVIKAVIHYTEGRETWENVEAELIDNLAMLIRLVKEGDQVIGFTPPTEVQRLNATAQPFRENPDSTTESFRDIEETTTTAQPVSDGSDIARKVFDALRRHGLQEEFARIAYEVVLDSYPAAPGGQ